MGSNLNQSGVKVQSRNGNSVIIICDVPASCSLNIGEIFRVTMINENSWITSIGKVWSKPQYRENYRKRKRNA